MLYPNCMPFQKVLNLLTDAPTVRYEHAYQLPTDNLIVHAITVNDNLVEYQIYGDMIYADTNIADIVISDYTFRQQEHNFPAYFTIALQYALATAFASSIARDSTMITQMSALADRAMMKARSVDSQQQTTRKLVSTRFISERRS